MKLTIYLIKFNNDYSNKFLPVDITISKTGVNVVNIPDGYDTIISVMYKNTDNGLWYNELGSNIIIVIADIYNNNLTIYCSEIPYYTIYRVTLVKIGIY